MTKKPPPKSTTTASATNSVTQGTLSPGLKNIELFGYDYFDVGWPAEAPPNGDDGALEQLYFHLHHTKSVVNELTERICKMETVWEDRAEENATITTPSTTPTTTAEGTPSTQPTPGFSTDPQLRRMTEENATLRERNAALEAKVQELEIMAQSRMETIQANAQLAEESTRIVARNAALEENDTHMAAELERRQDELVAQGKKLDRCQEANADLLDRLDKVCAQKQSLERACQDLTEGNVILRKDYAHLQGVNERNIDRNYDVNAKVEKLKSECARLRKAVLEQATVFATALKALID